MSGQHTEWRMVPGPTDSPPRETRHEDSLKRGARIRSPGRTSHTPRRSG